MYLKSKKEIKNMIIEQPNYDYELDNESSVLFDICKYLHQTRSIEFIVEGFGSERWPVDCEFDLPSVIEELPEIIQNFNNNQYNCILGFYEQGVMREIIISDKGDGNLLLECKSLIPGFLPKPSCIIMDKSTVKKMFEQILRTFINYSRLVCPNLLNEQLFIDWMTKFNISYLL